MRSQHADRFNHDADADGYDRDVQNEAHPIRAGYGNLLNWIASMTNERTGCSVLELGSGSGNLSTRLKTFKKLTCVDISEKMSVLAKQKFVPQTNVEFVISDLLQFFDQNKNKFDFIISTYAIHHLTEAEKQALFEKMYSALNHSGVIACGDLMFENEQAKQNLLKIYLDAGKRDLVNDINDEFFWDLSSAKKKFQSLGCDVIVKKFSDLSCGIAATKK